MGRRLVLPLLAAAALAGCGSASVDELPPPAGPAEAPATSAAPAGRVVPADGPQAAGVEFAPTAGPLPADDERLQARLDVRARELTLMDPDTGAVVDRAAAGVGPTNIATIANRVYVADTGGEALLVFHTRPQLTLTRRVHLPGGPFGLAVDREHKVLWVAMTATNELATLTADHQATPIGRLPALPAPRRVAVDSGTVAVLGDGGRSVQLVPAQETHGEDEG